MMRDDGGIISVGGLFFTTDIATVTANVETSQSIKVEPAACVVVTPEFLAAADVEADTPITINPVMNNELSQKDGEFRADGKHPRPAVGPEEVGDNFWDVLSESARETLREMYEADRRFISLKSPTAEDIAAMRERNYLPPLSAEDMAELVRRNQKRAADNAQKSPPVDPEEIRLAREAYARGEGIDVGDVLKELLGEK